jgi:dihydrodipicolinate synthase/N-acetylneuraminate lyase
MHELGRRENQSDVIVAQTAGEVDLARIPSNISFLLNQSLDALVVSSTLGSS